MASVPWCGVAWLPTGRNMMKAESGRKLQPRCQMSTQGLQQAPAATLPSSVFLVVVVWTPHTPAFTTLPGFHSAPCIAQPAAQPGQGS